ncbi:MAG: metallophosphoesterase [Marinobacter sp. T13-3]|jgi:Icc-related predicted phosphoesterase|nr:MAG: metallophosphoesterase [Marinobacter sp. T13-3]
MRLVCISDTHGLHRRIPDIPDGDVLIHAGDSLAQGTLENIADLNDWLGTMPHRHKILIAGNHDWAFQRTPEAARLALSNAIYLEDSGVELGGVRFWGSPWTPQFMRWAFMADRGSKIEEKWSKIPANTDVLITHGPPRGIGDQIDLGFGYEHPGCDQLLRRVGCLNLAAHIFGHIHEGYGKYLIKNTYFLNASTCTEWYEPVNPPIILEL